MRYIESAITLEYDTSKCDGCGLCVIVCPHASFAMLDKRAVLVDRGACMECSACVTNCEPGAITVRKGVGCAAGVLIGWLTGTESRCGCDGASSSCC